MYLLHFVMKAKAFQDILVKDVYLYLFGLNYAHDHLYLQARLKKNVHLYWMLKINMRIESRCVITQAELFSSRRNFNNLGNTYHQVWVNKELRFYSTVNQDISSYKNLLIYFCKRNCIYVFHINSFRKIMILSTLPLSISPYLFLSFLFSFNFWDHILSIYYIVTRLILQ